MVQWTLKSDWKYLECGLNFLAFGAGNEDSGAKGVEEIGPFLDSVSVLEQDQTSRDDTQTVKNDGISSVQTNLPQWILLRRNGPAEQQQ